MPNKKPSLWQIIAAIILMAAVGIGLLIKLTQWDAMDQINVTTWFLIPKHSQSYAKRLFHIMSRELDQFPQNLPEETMEEGIVSILHGTMDDGTRNLFHQFVDNSTKGKAAQMIIVVHTAEGDSIYKNVLFDGEHFFAVIDTSRDRFKGESEENMKLRYAYLIIITHPETEAKFVILTDDTGLTFEKLRDAQIGSDMESINSYQLFSYSE